MLKKTILYLCIFAFSCLFAQESGEMSFGKYYTINSKILNQKRVLLISLPDDYDASKREYPVLYILDGAGSFQFSSAVVNFLSGSGRIPPMIVVAIPNIDRTYDLTPGKLLLHKSGNGKNFLKFLVEEARQFVDDNFRTNDYNILSGHSLGGNFTVFSLFEDPESFNAYIAVSPYLASGDYFTLNLVKKKINDIELDQRYLYTTFGNEPPYFEFMNEFQEIVKIKKEDGFNYFHKEIPTENHMSMRLKGLYNGLEKLFEEWILTMEEVNEGIDAIEDHFDSFEDKFGYEYLIPESLLNSTGYALIENNKLEIALPVFRRNTQLYPESANAFHSYGEALEKNQEYNLAMENYKKAVQLAEEFNHPNVNFFRKELMEVQRKIISN